MVPKLCVHLLETVPPTSYLLPSRPCPVLLLSPIPAPPGPSEVPVAAGSSGRAVQRQAQSSSGLFPDGDEGHMSLTFFFFFFFLTYKWCQSYRVSSISCLCRGEPGGSSSPMLPRPPPPSHHPLLPRHKLASKAGRKDGRCSQSAFWTLVPTPHAVPGGLRGHGPGTGKASSPPSPPKPSPCGFPSQGFSMS